MALRPQRRREIFGASACVSRKYGTVTTCASTSGYMHENDNRYLRMNLKRIIPRLGRRA